MTFYTKISRVLELIEPPRSS